MSGRTFEVNCQQCRVSSTCRITQYGKDEFGLRFTRLRPEPGEERVVRYSPQLSKNRESALLSRLSPIMKMCPGGTSATTVGKTLVIRAARIQ